MTFLESTADENLIVEVAYDMANKMYGYYFKEFDSLRIEKDDWLQDAVMYILGLFRKNYFELKEDLNPDKIIYVMLKRFIKNKFQLVSKKQKRLAPNLDNPISSDSEGHATQLDQIMQKRSVKSHVEKDMVFEEDMIEGKKYLEDIVNRLDVTEFSGSKHTYRGKYHKNIGRNFKFSEKNIGKLLITGSTRKDILKAYGVLVPNIGADSKATFVNRKAKYVMAKIASEIEKLPEDAQNAVKTYILNME